MSVPELGAAVQGFHFGLFVCLFLWGVEGVGEVCHPRDSLGGEEGSVIN